MRIAVFGLLSVVALSLFGIATLQAADGDNPFLAKTVATSSDGTTWIQIGEQRWQLADNTCTVTPSSGQQVGGLYSGKHLVLLGADGTPQKGVLMTQNAYVLMGVRPEYLVAVTGSPARLVILDRQTGAEIRSVALGEGRPLSLALHPTSPVAYVCMARSSGILNASFLVIDEKQPEVHEDVDFIGQAIVVEPSGRFLMSAYSESFQTGAQLVHIPGRPQSPAVPNRPVPGVRSPGVPRRGIQPTVPQPGIPRSGPQPNPSGDRWGVIRRYGAVSIAFVYDLEEPNKPEGLAFWPKFTSFERGLRLSYNGRALTGVTTNSSGNYGGIDLIGGGKATVEYHWERAASRPDVPADIAHHPFLPLTAVARDSQITFFDTDRGTAIPARPPIDLSEFTGRSIQRILFAPDGKHLLILAQEDNHDLLIRVPLALSGEESAAMTERANHPAVSFRAAAQIPLAKLDAFRGGLAKPLRTAEISKEYSDAVVVIHDEASSGTGYIVGEAGYILTCAHCVSPLRPVTVVYHPQGKPDEHESVDATILQRDRKLDLALLQIQPKSPLHSVRLAFPVAVDNGEDVTIIANPGLGKEILDNTVTTGVVSSGKRTIEGKEYIQSSAAVNPGSSGGPMFNHNGDVIGTVDLKGRIEGVGFAIPVPTITRFLIQASLQTGNDGKLQRNWLDVSETREMPGMLISAKDHTLVISKSGTADPISIAFDRLSAGDLVFLDILSRAK